MNATTPTERGDLADRSECCIRKWATAVESRLKERVPPVDGNAAQFLHPYVAVSAESGIEDEHLANCLARQFGWECVDTKLLDYIVQHYDWDQIALDYANESAAAWFQEKFGRLCGGCAATSSDKHKQPGPVFYLAAHCGSYVFVDPLAPFYLPAECGLTVRLIAPKEQRLATIAKARNCSLKQAAAVLASSDHANAEFVKQNFRKIIADPHQYDLVINLAHASLDSALDLILGAYLLRFQPAQVMRPFELKSHRGSQRL